MAIAFESLAGNVTGSGVTSVTLNWEAGGSTPNGQVLIACFALEGVAAGSGPYVSSVVQGGWNYLTTQAPSGTGTGVEIWYTNGWSSGPTTQFNLAASSTIEARGMIFNDQFVGLGNVVRTFTSTQVTGNNPAAGSVSAFAGEMVVAVPALTLNSPGFGLVTSPAGFSQAFDNTRAGFGTAELAGHYRLQASTGATGAIDWTATASSPSANGATITFVLRAPTTSAPQLQTILV